MLARRDARSLASEDNGYVDRAGDGHDGRARRCGGSPRPRTRPPWPERCWPCSPWPRRSRCPPGQGGVDFATGSSVCVLLALFSTLPLGLLWTYPAAAAVAVAAACVLSLAAFHTLTVAGLIAQLIALYRLGRSGPQLLAAALALPFLVLALLPPTGTADRILAVLLAALGPAAAWAGAARRARSEAAGAQRRPGRSSPAPCSSTRRAGNAPGSPASCTTSWPTTFP